MSQSPIDDFSDTTTTRYRQGWKALNRLLHEGRSFSGHERHCAFLNTLGSSDDGRFATISAVSGLDFPEDGRATVMTDWDFDGKLDVWVAGRTGPRLRFMRNTMPTENHFVAIRLQGDGRRTNRDAIGARVELTLKGDDRPIIKTLHAGDSFLSQSGAWLYFGLGEAAEVEDVVVRWPGGEPQRLGSLQSDQRYVVSQSSGEVEVWTPPTDRKPLVASAPQPNEPEASTRTVLTTRLLLPNIETHEDASPLNGRLDGATLITLWSATCGPCIVELKELAEQEKRLRERGLDVVAVNLDHLTSPSDDANAILDRLGFPFRAEQGKEQLVRMLDMLQRSVLDRWQDLAVPTSFLIDPKGRLAVIYRGPVSVEQVLDDVPLLEMPAVALRDAATPFSGRWRSGPAATDPLRLTSQLIDGNLLNEGVDYLQLYADLMKESPEVLNASEAGETLYVLGVLRKEQGNLDAAIAAYRQALEIDPHDVRVRKDLATLLAKMGRIDDAAIEIAQALQSSPDDIDSLRKLGLLRMAQRRWSDAIEAFRRVAAEEPGDVVSLYNLANAYRSVGQLNNAMEFYRRTIDQNPQMVLAANNLAWIQATHPDAELRDGDEALRLARSVCEATKYRDPGLLDTLAAAQAESGDFAGAVETIERAIELRTTADAPAESLRDLRARRELYQQGQPYRDVESFAGAEGNS